MFVRQQLTQLALLLGAWGQLPAPSGPRHQETISTCNEWYTVRTGDTCFQIEQAFDISHEQFLSWNAAITEDCLTNLWPEYLYCVGNNEPEESASPPSRITISIESPSSMRSVSSLPKTIDRAISSPTEEATYSIRIPIAPWNLSTPTFDMTWPPKRTQAGQPSHCNKWYLVGGGDTCHSVYRKFQTSMTKNDL